MAIAEPQVPLAARSAPPDFLRAVEEEIARARRTGHPLCAIAAAPRLLPAEHLRPAEVADTSATLRRLLRKSDQLAWIDAASILVVLPETEEVEAKVVAYRLRTELERRRTSEYQPNWRTAVMPLRDEHSAEALLDAALAEMLQTLT